MPGTAGDHLSPLTRATDITPFDPLGNGGSADSFFDPLDEFLDFEQPPEDDSGPTSGDKQPSLLYPDTSMWIVPNFLSNLGVVQRIEGSTQSWEWVIDQLKSYPQEFALQAHTMFLHKEMYRDSMPQPIRAAFGICSASCLVNERNQEMLFRLVDAEVLELLKPPDVTTLQDDLARLQGLVLYQIIRFFQGGIKQRAVAEQQRRVVLTRALKLVIRSEVELRGDEAEDRHTWILAESIRRTAVMIYILYGVNSLFREGICLDLPTLRALPVSTSATFWNSETERPSQPETISYEAFHDRWLVSTPRKLDAFEKLLLIPCKGLEAITAFHDFGI